MSGARHLTAAFSRPVFYEIDQKQAVLRHRSLPFLEKNGKIMAKPPSPALRRDKPLPWTGDLRVRDAFELRKAAIGRFTPVLLGKE